MEYKEVKTYCPICEQDVTIEYCDFLDVGKEPEGREQVFDKYYFTYRCPHCEDDPDITDQNFVYYDPNNLFIVVMVQSDVDDFLSIIPKDKIEKYNLCTKRVVHSPNELRRTIEILEHGYDDNVIELYSKIAVYTFEKHTGLKADYVVFGWDGNNPTYKVCSNDITKYKYIFNYIPELSTMINKISSQKDLPFIDKLAIEKAFDFYMAFKQIKLRYEKTYE